MFQFLSGSYSIWYLRHEEDHIKNTYTFFDYFIKSCIRDFVFPSLNSIYRIIWLNFSKYTFT